MWNVLKFVFNTTIVPKHSSNSLFFKRRRKKGRAKLTTRDLSRDPLRRATTVTTSSWYFNLL